MAVVVAIGFFCLGFALIGLAPWSSQVQYARVLRSRGSGRDQ